MNMVWFHGIFAPRAKARPALQPLLPPKDNSTQATTWPGTDKHAGTDDNSPVPPRYRRLHTSPTRSVYQEEITLRAAALTYNTLLSLVPLLAVGFALFKAFGGLQKLEGPLRQLIMENLAVGRGVEVGQWLDQFIAKIKAGAIAGVGVLVLFYSAVTLLTNIEGSFNRIWGIQRGRSLVVRF